MTLGERIMNLRMERQMSQSDLAEALDVSRQSISKWETNSSVPELEKLVMLCEIFGVSMDMLVRGVGEAASEDPKTDDPSSEQEKSQTEPVREVVVRVEGVTPRKIAGMLLLSFSAVCVLICALMGALAEGLIIAVPFIICGLICVICKKRAGLWCCWAVYCIVTIAAPYMVGGGIGMGLLVTILRYGTDVVSVGMPSIIMSVVSLLCMIGLYAFTVFSYRKEALLWPKENKKTLLIFWAVFAVLWVLLGFGMSGLLGSEVASARALYLFLMWARQIAGAAVLAVLLVMTYHGFIKK